MRTNVRGSGSRLAAPLARPSAARCARRNFSLSSLRSEPCPLEIPTCRSNVFRAAQRALLSGLLLCCAVGVGGRAGGAEEERKEARVVLSDGTAFDVTATRVAQDQVLLVLPRARVASVDGKPLSDSIAAGAPAPDFTGVDVAGVSHTLSQLRGRVVLIKFWATWCPHCRVDIPLMKDLFTRYHDKGVEILACSVDQNPDQLKQFVREHEMSYPVISVYGQPKEHDLSELPIRYDMEGVPNYFLIGADGVIVKRLSGSLVEAHYDIEQDVNKLLAAR